MCKHTKNYWCLRKSVLQTIHSQGPSTSQIMEKNENKWGFLPFCSFWLLQTLPQGLNTWSLFPAGQRQGTDLAQGTRKTRRWHIIHAHQVSSWRGNPSALQASNDISQGKILIESEMELQNLHVARRCVLQCGSVFSWSFACSTLRSSIITKKLMLLFKCKMKHIDCQPGRENWDSKVKEVCGLRLS